MNRDDLFDWEENKEDELFSDESAVEFFFEEGHRAEYIDELLNLANQEELFAFVQGPIGIGKTCVLRELIKRCPEPFLCAYIEIPLLVDPISVLENISRQWEVLIPPESDPSHYIYSLRHFIQAQVERGGVPLLVIDDADALPDDALRMLLKLISQAGSPHFIFAVHDSTLQQRIHALVPFFQTATITLRPLAEAEVVSYIEQYLEAFRIDVPLSDDDIYDIYLSSRGHIGQINQHIHEWTNAESEGTDLTNDFLTTDRADFLERAQKISTPQIPGLHIGAVILAIVILGALSVYFMNHSTYESKMGASNPHIGATPVGQPLISSLPSALPSVESSSNTAQSLTTPLAAAEAVTTALPSPTSVPSKPTPTSAKPNSAQGTTSSWLLTAPPSNFTLQIMGSFSKETVMSLVKRQNNSKQWALYETRRDNKAWFVAVYGNYASKEAAKAAAEKLPPGLKEGKPWPKAIGDIQKEIKR